MRQQTIDKLCEYDEFVLTPAIIRLLNKNQINEIKRLQKKKSGGSASKTTRQDENLSTKINPKAKNDYSIRSTEKSAKKAKIKAAK